MFPVLLPHCCHVCVAAGATALISDSGLLAVDQLVVCNLTSSTFSNCQRFSTSSGIGLTLTQITGTFTDGSTVW